MVGARVREFNVGSIVEGSVADGAVDGVSDTDGIEVVSAALGSAFPEGLFVAQDGSNTRPAGNQNYKLVPWAAIAGRFSPPLLVEPSVDPRKLSQSSAVSPKPERDPGISALECREGRIP